MPPCHSPQPKTPCWRRDRDAVKRRRDLEQAKAVAHVAKGYLDLNFNTKELSALPLEMVKEAGALARAG